MFVRSVEKTDRCSYAVAMRFPLMISPDEGGMGCRCVVHMLAHGITVFSCMAEHLCSGDFSPINTGVNFMVGRHILRLLCCELYHVKQTSFDLNRRYDISFLTYSHLARNPTTSTTGN